ncbi:acyltransferase [Leucobacter rhizosphaerae]|uniref:Acyltransferase n=1 Tax=Leucobacter rhizosphaerae TaxID=2932245 RepID=A0ABY4FUF9_9MICO|nr:acyltransferase [Leucobacter rhizosphaerae]UOQ59923.1 acyltransferase [Leucobacter rhizosphaerae]
MSSLREASLAGVSSPARSKFFGTQLDPKNNSLNLIRLVLASTVLFAHTYFIIGLPPEVQPAWGGQHLGAWAVAGFFAASGYLITASRQRTRFANFLLLRIGRIFPAFLAVLLVTVVLFGPVAHLVNHGTLVGYLRTPPSPLSYVFQNLFLEVRAYAIGDTLGSVPYPNVWNGSLWTLFYEFLCYMFVGVLLIWRRARTSVWPIAIAFVLSVVVYAKIEFALSFLDGNESFRLLAMLLPYFLGGALMRFVLPYFGLHWIPGVLSLAVVVIGIGNGPIWTAQLTAPLLAYGLLWLSTVVPQPSWIARNDVSYGVYVYAFPVQQLLAVFGLAFLGPWAFSFAALAVTAVFAVASWYLVERPALRRTRVATGRDADRVSEPETGLTPAEVRQG